MPELNQTTVLREITLSRVDTDGSLTSSQEGVSLTNDEDAPGANQVYGTNASGVKGWKDDPTSVTSGAIVTALGYTPESTSNKATSFGTVNDTLFPTVEAVHENTRRSVFYNVTTIAALQTYLAALANDIDVNIFFPLGTYSVTTPVTIANKSNVKIFSEGAILVNALTATGAVFDIDNVTSIRCYGFDINMNLNTFTTTGIDVNNVARTTNESSWFDKLNFYNFNSEINVGIRLEDIPKHSSGSSFPTAGINITNCNFYNTLAAATAFNYNSNTAKGIGLNLHDNVEYFQIVNCQFINLNIAAILRNGANGMIQGSTFLWCNPRYSATNYGTIQLEAGSANNNGKVSIVGNRFNHNWGYCINSTMTVDTRPLIITGNYFIANAIRAIGIQSTSGYNIITGNYFNGSNTSQTIATNSPFAATACQYMVIQSSNNVISGNVFMNVTSSQVAIMTLTGSDNNVINNNKFETGLAPYTLAGTADIAEIPSVTATLNFGSTAAQSSADLTVTVTGAADGDVVTLGILNAAVNANTCYTAWVSAANTVTVRFNNYSSGAVDPASATFRIAVTKY